jgi:hypothetical protein
MATSPVKNLKVLHIHVHFIPPRHLNTRESIIRAASHCILTVCNIDCSLSLQGTELASLSAEDLLDFLRWFIAEISQILPPGQIYLATRNAWLNYEKKRHAAPQPAATGWRITPPSTSPQRAMSPGRTPLSPPIAAATPDEDPAIAATQLQGQAALEAGMRLQLRHSCQAQSCGDAACEMCRYNPTRRCSTNLREPPYTYTVGEAIHSPCGAVLQVVLVDADGNLVQQADMLLGYSILITVVDDRRYQELEGVSGASQGQRMGQQIAHPAVDDAILQTGDGVAPLLFDGSIFMLFL